MSEQYQQQQGSHRANEDEPVGGYGDQGEAEALTQDATPGEGASSGEDASSGADEASNESASPQEAPEAP